MRCEDCGMTIGHNDECPRVAPDVIERLKAKIKRARIHFEHIVGDSCTDKTTLGKRVYDQATLALEELRGEG